MLSRIQIVRALTVSLLITSIACGASKNLVRNEGFERTTDGRLDNWSIYMDGDWVGIGSKAVIQPDEIISLSTDAHTGQQALMIDTRALNPSGKITDELRNWKQPKYEILFTQRVSGIQPNSWYLVKFRIKSSQIDVDEGLQLLSDLKPFPYPIVRLESFGPTPWGRQTIEGRARIAHAPKSDGEYHEYVMLQQTMNQTEALEVGVRIRAPWTGQIILDDVEVHQVDPEKDMTKMERLLAMRSAKPIEKVRELNPETTLVDAGAAAATILVPDNDAYKPLAARIQERISKLTGVKLPVVTKLDQVADGQNIIALGNINHNDLVARLHFNRYVKIDALSPGPGGYVVWSVPEPYGLARKQNVIVVSGSDAAGQQAAVDAFCKLLSAKDKSIQLPFLHTVYPKRKLSAEERVVNRKAFRMRDHYAAFSKKFIHLWLETGDLDAARLARKEMLRGVKHYLDNPYTHEAWASYDVGLAWDTLEETPVFTDKERLAITNWLLAYLHARTKVTSDWYYMVPHLTKNTPIWNHQAKGLAAMYAMGRYFKRFYGDHDARFDYYLGGASNAFREQAKWSKPEENSGNYWQITMRFSIMYYLGEWDMTFFENDASKRYAEYMAIVHNNKGWLSGFGDTYYCYHGSSPFDLKKNEDSVPLAFWYYRDGRMLWWLKQVLPGYENPYHQDVQPVEWKELLGVKKNTLEPGLYDPRTRLELWGSDGEGCEQPVGDIKYEETFDKISFREDWDADGDYMLLEGLGRGIHSGHATNQIAKLTMLGEDLLIGSVYFGNTVRTNCSVFVVKDMDLNDPAIRGKKPGRRGGFRWRKLARQYPAYAAADTVADLPNSGLTKTSMRDFLGGTDWTRNVFWLKGKYFALIDEIIPKEAGTYYIESNLRTCPNRKKETVASRLPPATADIIPRAGKVLPGNRGYEVSIATEDKMKQYILTDGSAAVVTDSSPAKDITSVIVRQVHKDKKLAAGQKVTYINLLCSDREGERTDYRIERLSPTEGLIFQGDKPVAYIGCGQSDRTKAILPIKAKMFMLTDGTLAMADATSAGEFFASAKPASSEVKVPNAGELLRGLAALIDN